MIDAMTLPQVGELFAYWAEHPPLHLMLGAWLGIARNGRQAAAGDAATLLAALGPGFCKGDVHRGLPPVVLDVAELRRRAADAG